MNRNSILFLAHSHSIHTHKWVAYFIEKKWNVNIISFHPQKIVGANNLFLNAGKIKPDGNNYRYLLKMFQVAYHVWKIKPDILNCHYLSSYGVLGYLSFYKNLTVTLYGSDIYLFANKNFIFKLIANRVLHKARLIFSVSEKMTDVITKQFSLDPNKIITKQYGVDLYVFRCTNATKNRSNIFVTNRSFTENSNYHKILEIMYGLQERKFKFNLLIVGSGPLKEQIYKMIEKFNLTHSVSIMDSIDQKKLAELLNESLIYLSIPNSDGTPLSVFEAAACGAYPVLSDIQANREWLEKGLQGLSLDINNIPKATESVIDLFMKIDSVEYLQKNIEFVSKHMDYSKNMSFIAQQMENVLKC